MPLDSVNRDILTIGSSQDSSVVASALAGLCSNYARNAGGLGQYLPGLLSLQTLHD